MINPELLDTILLEWSYRLKDGIPDVNDPEKVKVLNQVLAENKLPTLESLLVEAEGAEKTDIQESLVCYFYDIICKFPKFKDVYYNFLEKSKSIKKEDIKQAIESTLYGLKLEVDTKIDPEYMEILADIVDMAGKTTPGGMDRYGYDKTSIFSILENSKSDHGQGQDWIGEQYSQARTIYKEADSKFKQYGLINRGNEYLAIRKKGLELLNIWAEAGATPVIQQYDKWTPADVFIGSKTALSDAAKAEGLTPGKDALNNLFYGDNNTSANILGVSLKMSNAKAGKGTSFLSEIKASKVIESSLSEDELTKGIDTNVKEFNTFKERVRQYNKYINSNSKSYEGLPDSKKFEKTGLLILRFFNKIKPNKDIEGILDKEKSSKERLDSFKTNQSKIITPINDIIKVEFDKFKKITNEFESAYTETFSEFENFLKSEIGSGTTIEGDASLKNIKQASTEVVKKANPSATDEQLKLLAEQDYISKIAKKTTAFKKAIGLIKEWENSNAETIMKPFKKLKQYDNPFLALTLYCICQYGLNPAFYKCRANTDHRGDGKWEFFPSNNLVDPKQKVNVEIVNSPAYAGFRVEFIFKFNSSLSYKTNMAFTYSGTSFKIEVEELEEA